MMEVEVIEGNSQKLDGGAMFGNAPKALWQRYYKADEHNRISLATRGFLITVQGVRILLETGIGAFFSPEIMDRFGVEPRDRNQLLTSLQKKNIALDSIDVVILSHLHFDHSGGLVTEYSNAGKQGIGVVFPRAEIWVGKVAWQRALTPHSRDRASFVDEINQAIIQSKRLKLINYQMSELSLFAEKVSVENSIYFEKIKNHLKFFISEGHTIGQILTYVFDHEQSLCFTGDLVPGVAWLNPSLTMGYDRYAEKLIDEKNLFLNFLSKQGTELMFVHDPKVKMAKIFKNEKNKFAIRDNNWED